MASPGSKFPIHILPAAALVAALAACQPQQPPAPAGTAPAADAAAQGAGFPPGERINFQCSDLAVGATFDDGGQTVRLSYSGQRLELPGVTAASGARYADEAGNQFWGRGQDKATLVLAGQERRECVRSDRPSPWDVAADNGVAFRAVGQEPGWLVELHEDGADAAGASLTAHLDYGQRLLEVTSLEHDADTWRGRAADGTGVELAVQERDCTDSMSGEQFRAAATLVVDGQQYEGCGAWLAAD